MSLGAESCRKAKLITRCYTTDTIPKVVHVGGKNAADKSVITAADVNNFAAANGTIVKCWRFKAQSDRLTQLWASTVLHNPP
jgi:hypothetical protein